MKFKKFTMRDKDKIVITYVFDLWAIQIKIRRIKNV